MLELQSTDTQLDAAVEALAGRTITVLTGAGVSTDSGIPDYRGAGAPRRNPMTIEQFLASPRARQRYWAGSHLGYPLFNSAQPNAGHRALAELEAHGNVAGVVTQNVDGLHVRAGSRHVVPLHGAMDRVVCLNCGQVFARPDIELRIDAANPWLAAPEAVVINPDGDAEVAEVDEFVVPECTVCGGPLKPDVVFFGEFVPVDRFAEAKALIAASDALLVAGSSLVVNTGIRLIEQARRRKLPIVVINRGETKADSRATVKIDGGASEYLTALADRLER
ncbi:Sir2 family NAD-dependent protein deacetylase [Gryllotalpicola protaetiae]|uniref:protein acetyllysine N-acetyltransferase n=1 Tax=Gryllotalpicola protaetiae TaxID=2419771 RepID=A0A387BUT8_9MICO|nr:Sir2 family NAD-dependent protein deacetylase [Gryllotalpicola protaetiae]AYG04846.1 NAD-dependent deacetylase [Gryllotalpicola protaetiae]